MHQIKTRNDFTLRIHLHTLSVPPVNLTGTPMVLTRVHPYSCSTGLPIPPVTKEVAYTLLFP